MQQYDLDKISRPTQVEFTVDENRQQGQLPIEFLTSKFEETYMGDDDISKYADYARSTLTNWGPDTNLMEYEEARGGVEARGGKLRLRIYGSRGDADPAAHPELFYGYADPGDWDPRGTADEPDMKRVAEQWNARMRFQRWDPDGCEFETSGRRNEWRELEDRQTVFKWVRDRLKIFLTQKDGRREGLRRTWQYRPDVSKCVLVRGYGDYIEDQGLTPQRRSVRISDKIIRDSVAFRRNCDDQRRDVMRYGLQRRGRRVGTSPAATASVLPDGEFAASETQRCYRAVSMLLSELVRGKHQLTAMAADSDADYAASAESVARKQAAAARDLALIMQSITADNEWSDAELTRVMRTAKPQQVEHLARVIVRDHLLPANTYLNAVLMAKGVRQGADLNAVRREMITDTHTPDVRDVQSVFGKIAHAVAGGASREHIEDADRAESRRVHNYRAAVGKFDTAAAGRQFASDGELGAHSQTQSRRLPKDAVDRIVRRENIATMSHFRDNQYKDRHVAPLGGKYLVREMAQDARHAEMSALGTGA
jgi:hypothetical protein